MISPPTNNDGEIHADSRDLKAAECRRGPAPPQSSRAARQDPGRLGWDVHVVDGRASDTFDTLTPTYILAISNSGEVAGARGCFRRLADQDYGRLSLASSEWAARRALRDD